jgi:hypothetical protein
MTFVPERWDVGKWDQAHWDGQLGVQLTPCLITVSTSSVSFRTSRSLAIGTAAVAVTGNTVSFRTGPRMTISAAAITVSASSVGLRAAYRMAIGTTAVAVTGNAVNLVRQAGAGNFQLVLDCARITVTPAGIDLVISRTTPSPPPPGILTFGRRVPLATPW